MSNRRPVNTGRQRSILGHTSTAPLHTDCPTAYRATAGIHLREASDQAQNHRENLSRHRASYGVPSFAAPHPPRPEGVFGACNMLASGTSCIHIAALRAVAVTRQPSNTRMRAPAHCKRRVRRYEESERPNATAPSAPCSERLEAGCSGGRTSLNARLL